MSKVALCVIGRLENRYAKEFVEHYKIIGFDKVFVYDNNRDGEECFEDVLGEYMEDGFVSVIPWKSEYKPQLPAYNDCYSKYGSEYDWIAFFDFDEFLIINNGRDIHDLLSSLDGFDCVLVNWMNYTDGNQIHDDGRPLLERFTIPMAYDKRVSFDFPENNHVKCIVKGGRDCLFTATPHVPTTPMTCCTAKGARCDQTPFVPYDHSVAYLKHFTTKTAEEWVTKWRRGTPDRSYVSFENRYRDYFFKINEKTEEKVKYLSVWAK